MSEFSIIADMSECLLKKLRDALCPEAMQSPESIQLASPSDKNGDFQLGLFLYDIRDLNEYRTSQQTRGTDNVRTFPPKPLTLNYMLFLNSRAQIAAGAEAEQRILGRALQALSDEPIIDVTAAHSYKPADEEDAGVTFLNLSFEDKTKIWSSLSVPYQVGVYFSVSPVLLSSRRVLPFSRVVATETSVEQLDQR